MLTGIVDERGRTGRILIDGTDGVDHAAFTPGIIRPPGAVTTLGRERVADGMDAQAGVMAASAARLLANRIGEPA